MIPIMSFSIIFGLTADPIHKGHEQAIINGVEFLRNKGFEIRKFLLVPVFQPNLIANKKAPVAGFKQRFEMCELVAKRLSHDLNCCIVVSPIEQQLAETTGEKNYSFNTIKYLSNQNASVSIGKSNRLFMVSADHFNGRWPKFRKWHNWQQILQYSGLLINQRPGHRINSSFLNELRDINPNIFAVSNRLSIDTSSTQIRENISSASIKQHLSEDVYQYIMRNKLY
jgi:nicotinate (nicotinamide) nucleotide adenylyltransferase